MSGQAIEVRFHHAMYMEPANEGWLMGFWQTLPQTPLASLTIRYGDGSTEVVLPYESNPLTSGGLSHTYALSDGILDTYAARLTGAIEGGGTVVQQFRFIVDAANTADRSFLGTGYSDAVLCGAGNDTFNGLNGHDLVHGGGGNDLLAGGIGDDTLEGDAGNDTLIETGGTNVMFGGDGSDSMMGGTGSDYMIGDGFGGGWNDTLNGGGGIDDLFGYGGNDLLIGGIGDDYLDGGDDHDRLYGGDGADAFFGGAGNDYARGDAGDDHVMGNDGNDMLFGNAGADTLGGGGGNDMLRLGALDGAADMVVLAAGSGLDRVYEFEAGLDRILIEGVAAIPEARFVAGAVPRAPLGSDPVLLYNTVSGRLYLDLDGRGGNAAELLAIFDGQPALDYADFLFA